MNQKQRKKLLIQNGFSDSDAEIISQLSVAAGTLRNDEVNEVVKTLGGDGLKKINRATEIFSQMIEFRKNKRNDNLM